VRSAPPPLPIGEERRSQYSASQGESPPLVPPPLPLGEGRGEGAPPVPGREARRRAPAVRRDVVAGIPRTRLPRTRRPRPARGLPRRPGPRQATGGVSYGANDATFRARPARANPRPA